MGAALTRCTCLEGWLLADPTIYEKLNALEAKYTTLETDYHLFKHDTVKRIETVEHKSSNMLFVQEEDEHGIMVVGK